MDSLINKTRLSGNVNEFIDVAMLACSEAIQRAAAVTICRSPGAKIGSDSCDQRSSDSSSGWLIYVGTAADSPNTAGHQILARQGAFAAGTSIAAASTATAITYATSGAPWPAPPGSFTFTFNNDFSRKVCFSLSGRISALSSGAEGCSA